MCGGSRREDGRAHLWHSRRNREGAWSDRRVSFGSFGSILAYLCHSSYPVRTPPPGWNRGWMTYLFWNKFYFLIFPFHIPLCCFDPRPANHLWPPLYLSVVCFNHTQRAVSALDSSRTSRIFTFDTFMNISMTWPDSTKTQESYGHEDQRNKTLKK